MYLFCKWNLALNVNHLPSLTTTKCESLAATEHIRALGGNCMGFMLKLLLNAFNWYNTDLSNKAIHLINSPCQVS